MTIKSRKHVNVGELNRRARVVDAWIARRFMEGAPTTADDTWRQIKAWWPKATLARNEYVFQKCSKASGRHVMGSRLVPTMRRN